MVYEHVSGCGRLDDRLFSYHDRVFQTILDLVDSNEKEHPTIRPPVVETQAPPKAINCMVEPGEWFS